MLILIKMPVHRQPFPNVSVSFRIRVLLQPIDERGSRERERERGGGGGESEALVGVRSIEGKPNYPPSRRTNCNYSSNGERVSRDDGSSRNGHVGHFGGTEKGGSALRENPITVS